MMKYLLFVLLLSLSFAVAQSPNDVKARNPTPSKRSPLPIIPRQPAPSKRAAVRQPPSSKRLLEERVPTTENPPFYVARQASPSKRLAARQASPSKRVTARQAATSPRYVYDRDAAPVPSKRFVNGLAAPLKRSIDEQHVVELKENQPELCLDGLMACPVLSTPGQFPLTFAEWEAVGFECVDFTADLRSCGGCSSLDPVEHDCTNIPHVLGVACVAGECQISSCQPGYSLQSDDQRCSLME